MALTALQRHVCRLLAEHRKRLGESYVAGGGALNEVVAGARRSRDVDRLFHDTEAALVATWANDRAAAGKDPGFSPLRIVEECARTHYAQSEIDSLDFDGPTPHAAEISSRWHAAVDEAREIARALPAQEAGKCVLDHAGRLERAPPAALPEELSAGRVVFHEGRIRGAFPELRIPAAPRS